MTAIEGPAQERSLPELEEVIERGRETFVDVGLALLEIRDRRLFREQGFTTFTDYCRQRWRFTPVRAVQLIQAAEVAGALTMVNAPLPENERQARALVPLSGDPEAMAEAWQEALRQAPRDPTTDAPVVRGRGLQEAVSQVLGRRDAKSHAQGHAERQARFVQAVPQRELPAGLEGLLDRVDRCDALTYLKRLPDACVDLCVTSPPYWGKRTYQPGNDLEVGQERDPGTYVQVLRRIVSQIGRVLRPEGWLFLNLGDTYASNPGGYRGDPARQRGISARARRVGATAPAARDYDVPKKSLCLVPWRVLTELVRGEGFRCRNVIAWTKPNHLPENVHDRLTQAWEPVFALTMSEHPYFQRGSREGDVWAISVGGDGVAQELEHPAPFPSKLVHRIIGHACPPGGVILDPFAGSGTVLRVARSEGRRFLGCDLVAWAPPREATG